MKIHEIFYSINNLKDKTVFRTPLSGGYLYLIFNKEPDGSFRFTNTRGKTAFIYLSSAHLKRDWEECTKEYWKGVQ